MLNNIEAIYRKEAFEMIDKVDGREHYSNSGINLSPSEWQFIKIVLGKTDDTRTWSERGRSEDRFYRTMNHWCKYPYRKSGEGSSGFKSCYSACVHPEDYENIQEGDYYAGLQVYSKYADEHGYHLRVISYVSTTAVLVTLDDPNGNGVYEAGKRMEQLCEKLIPHVILPSYLTEYIVDLSQTMEFQPMTDEKINATMEAVKKLLLMDYQVKFSHSIVHGQLKI